MTRTPLVPTADRSGFALLITITLVAFLVLILVTLASLTRVETQVASNSQQIDKARQNALLALNVALGQLQKYTGPDQRTTVRADIDPALANVTNANGRWVGAYGNAAAIDTAYALKPSQIPSPILAGSDAKGSQALLLNWLVSGNERVAFDPSTDVGADGHIITPPSLGGFFTPATATDLATASASPAPTDTQALLVGPGSATATSDYVTAPLVTLSSNAVPGITTSTPIGRYAWWVGDEGAKARVNLPQANGAQASAAFVSSQRAAIELLDGQNEVGSTNATDLIGAAYDPTLSALTKVFSPEQLSMLTPAAASVLPPSLRLRYHDLTASSTSVLADAYAGGLKKDLSAVLADGAISPADDATIFPPENNVSTDSFGVPNWGQLRSFAQTTSTNGVLPGVSLSTSTSVGIAPVLTYYALGMKYVAPNGVAADQPIRMALFPIVVLWNPYTATIPQHDFEVGFVRRFGSNSQSTTLEVETSPGTWTIKERISFNRNLATSGGTSNTYIRFRVQLPAGGIPPGASMVFTLPTGGATYNAPLNSQPGNVLTNGTNALGYVLTGSATFATGDEARNFRVFGMTQGGEICAYLGDVASAGTSGAASYLNNNGTNNHQWHQFVSQLSPGSIGGTGTYWQGGASGLVATNFFDQPIAGSLFPTPTLVCELQMSFGTLPSGAVNYPDVRWIAQTNPRAGIMAPTPGGGNPLNFSASSGNQNWPTAKFESGGQRASSGRSLDSDSAIVDTTLYEFRPDTEPLFSLGQLQHANLALHNGYPSYAIGNSLADIHFVNKRDQVLVPYTMTSGVDNPPVTQVTSYYDLSWLLNRTLWDRYFVSSVPHDGTGTAASVALGGVPDPLPNPRHARHGDPASADLQDADRAAANLLLTGGFNINSTSEQAWRAVLGGINGLNHDPEGDGTPVTLQAALPRFSRPTNATNAQSEPWQGYRELDQTQIAQLAANVVSEIRNRGPFVSLADFVNRRLKDNPATTLDERMKGVIQAALDATVTGAGAVNTAATPFDDAPDYVNTAYGTRFDPELMRGAGTAVAPVSSRAAFAPQLVTQADVLSAIGGGLSARSDTFTVRTYGEAINPVTQDIQSRAWCEAVVQRLPEYMNDAADSAFTAPGALSDADNRKFGRRYQIIAFRWLTPNDI